MNISNIIEEFYHEINIEIGLGSTYLTRNQKYDISYAKKHNAYESSRNNTLIAGILSFHVCKIKDIDITHISVCGNQLSSRDPNLVKKLDQNIFWDGEVGVWCTNRTLPQIASELDNT